MHKIPALTAKKVIDILEKSGFYLIRTSGSHFVYRNSISKKRVIVPYHKGDIPKGTLMSILSQAGISRDKINDLL